MPLPDEYGMNLAPNTASSIAVQMNQISRKPAPYTSDCMEDWSMANLTLNIPTNYSLSVIRTAFSLIIQDIVYPAVSESLSPASYCKNMFLYLATALHNRTRDYARPRTGRTL